MADKNEMLAGAPKAAAVLMCRVNTLMMQPVPVLSHRRLWLILRGTRAYVDVLVWTFQTWVQPIGGDDTINRH